MAAFARFVSCALAGLLLALAVPRAAAADVTGQEVHRAVDRAVEALRKRQLANGTWEDQNFPGGVTCLVSLALLQAGEPAHDPALSAAIHQIRRMPDLHTYVVSLKAMVLAQADGPQYRREIELAARWLIKAQTRGGLWGYTESGDRFDHSNSQFALLGLHAAAQAGHAIPQAVWRNAQAALLRNQNKDGGWAYQATGESFGSMTAAGVADLLIIGHTYEQGREQGFRDGAAPSCGVYRVNRPLAQGLEWLGRNFQAGNNPNRGSNTLYWLYAVERCGILSGRQLLGQHDWYREGAAMLVRTQGASGLWNESLVDTAFGLLFLAKGHKALLAQKLQWSADDAWNPDRSDLEHLVAFIGDALGQDVAWQVVPLDARLEDWLAAPLLYIQGHRFPQLDETQRARLRRYVEQGGTLLAEACCGRTEFRDGFERFAAETFPEFPLRELGPEHAVYHVLHDVEPYGLRGIDLGCRTSVLYSPRDLSCLWEQGDIPNLSKHAFRLGANIAAYAVGRRPLRDRLDAVVVPAGGAGESKAGPPAQDALRLAQIVYEGDWRPFPAALPNLAEFVRDQLGLDVVTQPREVRLTAPDLYTCPFLVLAGHYDFELSAAEREALAAHLKRGAFLLADACCGTEPFDTAFRRTMKLTFPDLELERLPADHPIVRGTPGFDVTTVRYSPDVTRAKPNLRAPELWGLRIDGRLAVVYSPYSLSCGLAGPVFEGCWGLASDDARRLAANIVLHALTH